MQTIRLIFVSISLFFLAGMVTAADLTPTVISNNNADWLVADGSSTSTITVQVKEGALANPVSNATVLFYLSDPTLGTVFPTNITTGSDGVATSVFTTTTKSGNATINAIIRYNDGADNYLEKSTFQRTDDDTPQTMVPSYNASIPVGSTTILNLTYSDRNNNRIDNRNTAETHAVHLSMPGSGGSGLFDGTAYVSSLDVATDADGRISVPVRVSTLAGNNLIQVDPIGNIATDTIYIVGIATNTSSCTLTQVPPSPSSWPADGDPAHYFDLYYYLKDQYENPVDGAKINIQSSAGYSTVLTTNSNGIGYIRYNASDVGGVYTITATTPANATILCTDTGTTGYCSQSVEFTSMEPVAMVLSASPQTMVSTDVDSASKAVLKARVMDVKGNPVSEWPKGTPVTVPFTQGPVTYPGAPGGTYTETVPSHLSAMSASMGANGTASVDFIPGKFVVYGQPGYNETATGTCTVTASWINPKGAEIKRDITFTWKNYPFLTIDTKFSRPSGYVGDFLNGTIKITGDGAALQPKPIDVLPLLDNSGSMGTTTDSSSGVSQSKAATIQFINGMEQRKDRVAVLFYDKFRTRPSPSMCPSRLTWIMQSSRYPGIHGQQQKADSNKRVSYTDAVCALPGDYLHEQLERPELGQGDHPSDRWPMVHGRRPPCPEYRI